MYKYIGTTLRVFFCLLLIALSVIIVYKKLIGLKISILITAAFIILIIYIYCRFKSKERYLLYMIEVFIFTVVVINITNFNGFQKNNDGWAVIKNETSFYFEPMISSLGDWANTSGKSRAFSQFFLHGKNLYTANSDILGMDKYTLESLPDKIYLINEKAYISAALRSLVSKMPVVAFTQADKKKIYYVFDKGWQSSTDIIVLSDDQGNNYFVNMNLYKNSKE